MSCIFSHLSQGLWYYASHATAPNWIKNGLLLGEKWLQKLSWLLPLNSVGRRASISGEVIAVYKNRYDGYENAKLHDNNMEGFYFQVNK